MFQTYIFSQNIPIISQIARYKTHPFDILRNDFKYNFHFHFTNITPIYEESRSFRHGFPIHMSIFIIDIYYSFPAFFFLIIFFIFLTINVIPPPTTAAIPANIANAAAVDMSTVISQVAVQPS